ncbi:hypothetical protein J2861_004988 [Agrobacterium tumefaciens]|nr:hypothetical protein [Agrobacterium tumefaciens]
MSYREGSEPAKLDAPAVFQSSDNLIEDGGEDLFGITVIKVGVSGRNDLDEL